QVEQQKNDGSGDGTKEPAHRNILFESHVEVETRLQACMRCICARQFRNYARRKMSQRCKVTGGVFVSLWDGAAASKTCLVYHHLPVRLIIANVPSYCQSSRE